MVVKVKSHKRSGGKVKVKAHKRSSPDTGDLAFKAGDAVKKKSGSKKKDSSLKAISKKEKMPKSKFKAGDIVRLAGTSKDVRLLDSYVERGVLKWSGVVVPVRGTIEVPIYPKDEDLRKLVKYEYPAEFKRSVSFVDKEGKNVKVEIEYKLLSGNKHPYFAITRDRAGSSGAGGWIPKNQPQKELLEMQEQWHLKTSIPMQLEKDVDSVIAEIKDAEDDEQDDLGLDGWQLVAMKELAKEADEVFTDARDSSYDGRFGNEDGVYLEGAGEYIVFESYDDAENACIDYVKEQLEEEPELFNQDWLNNYLTIDDAETIASEEGDSYANDIRDEEDGRRVCEEANREDEFDEIVEQIEEKEEKISDMEDAGQDDVLIDETRNKIEELESKKEELIDECVETVSENLAKDKQEQMENDVTGFLSDYGYDMSNLPSFVSIDVGEASQDAVDTDGVAHFFASYDGNEIELPSGAVAYRVN